MKVWVLQRYLDGETPEVVAICDSENAAKLAKAEHIAELEADGWFDDIVFDPVEDPEDYAEAVDEAGGFEVEEYDVRDASYYTE